MLRALWGAVRMLGCCGSLTGCHKSPVSAIRDALRHYKSLRVLSGVLWGNVGLYGGATDPTGCCGCAVPLQPVPMSPQVLCGAVVGLLAPPAPPTLAPALLQALAVAAALGGRLLRSPPRLPHGYGPCLVRGPMAFPHGPTSAPHVLHAGICWCAHLGVTPWCPSWHLLVSHLGEPLASSGVLPGVMPWFPT